MIVIGLCLIWPFLDSVAMKLISLEITNTLDCDIGYIEIRCVVKGELVEEIIRISLKKLDENFVTVNSDRVWEGKELANRSGIGVSSFIRYAGTSYLSIKIRSSVVKPQKDKGPFQCVLAGVDRTGGIFTERSTLEMLNIIGNVTLRLYIVCLVMP
ncbi:uncharacterized protein LOC144621871 [Crassostrea virginica]